MDKFKFCKYCGEKIAKDAIVCSKCGRQLEVVKEEPKEAEKKINLKKEDSIKIYQKKWFMWVMLFVCGPVGIVLMWKYHKEYNKALKIILTIVSIFVFFMFLGGIGSESESKDTQKNNTSLSKPKKQVQVIDFSKMQENEILEWCNSNNIEVDFKRIYSDSVAKDGFISQSVNANEKVDEGSTIKVIYSLGKEPTIEEKNALAKAQSYSDTMHMSKEGIYDQLISEYGEGFDKKSAKYADWNHNALEKAKSYRDTMHMSKSAIYDQLISSYGEKFTKKQAQYAIDNLE